MKKISLLLALMMVLTMILCGCQSNPDADERDSSADVKQEQTDDNAEDEDDADKAQTGGKKEFGGIVDPEDGTKFEIDTTIRGTIEENAAAVTSSEIVLDGIKIQLPFAASVLIDNGWSFPSSATAQENLLRANATTNLISFYAYSENGDELSLLQAVNNADTEKSIQECDITSFELSTISLTEDFGDCVLPGGISLYSTAADVLSVYGTPENNAYFETVYVYENGLRYENCKETGYSYSFRFFDEEDYEGQLEAKMRSVTVELAQ